MTKKSDLLNDKTKLEKISKIIGVFLWAPSSPDHNPLGYSILGVSENETNPTFHSNIGSLKDCY